VVQLVEQFLGGAVDLGVGLAHVLVQRLVRVDGALQVRDVGPGGARAQVAPATPLGNVFGVLKEEAVDKFLLLNTIQYRTDKFGSITSPFRE